MKKIILTAFCCLFLAAPAWAGPTSVTWYGHSAFKIVTPKGAVLMIDPWLNNPMNPAAKAGEPFKGIDRVDYILITHGHFDHVGDAVEIANQTGARLVANFELGTNLAKLQGYPKELMGFDTLFNIGGRITIANGEVAVTMTDALHSSGMNNPFAEETAADVVYGGHPAGFIIEIADGPTLYDTGDTAYFDGMKRIGKRFNITLALVNIGGHFGMEADQAAEAAKAVKARYVVPHHFGTFPVLTQNPKSFIKAVGRRSKVIVMKAGQSIAFDGVKRVR